MKRPFCIFRKNSISVHLIAATLIACMGLADVSLFMRYSKEIFSVNENEELKVVTQQHESESALADGIFDGRGSDLANGVSSSMTLVEGKHLFNILEILPTEKRGVIGYTIGGCEPFDVEEATFNGRLTTKRELKSAVIDAMINPEPGTDQANQSGALNSGYGRILWDINEKIKEGGTTYPFKFETGKVYNGYYKRVKDNTGVYCIDNPTSPTRKIWSKFKKPGRSDYNYIFVYGGTASTERGDIPVPNEKRIKYINQEKFITEWLGKDPSIKSDIEFEVTTRTPVTVDLDDIERADLIVINNNTKGTDQYYYALRMKNKLAGAGDDHLNDDFDLHYYSPEDDNTVERSKRIDFIDSVGKHGESVGGFEKVIRIYERIVVREDCALVAEKNCVTCYNGSTEITSINTNLRKLMFMLFYVQADGEKQAGRDLFSDFFKRYTDEPGAEYLEKRKLHLADPTDYPVDYRSAWLKRNGTDPTTPQYYYMHMETGNHIGHPLIIAKDECITGAKTQQVEVTVETSEGTKTTTVTLPVLDGDKIVPEHNSDTINSRSHEIIVNGDVGKGMFDDTGKFSLARNERQAGTDQMKYYASGSEYRYKNCYSSMSNTTDYIYIDNDGSLIVDTKYSSDQSANKDNYWKYWYKIDADFYPVQGNTFRRRKWQAQKWDAEKDDPWPWDSRYSTAYLEEWLMHRKTEGNIYDCNMHMWYDYGADAKSYGGKVYMTVSSPPFNIPYHNQSIMEENACFKGTWISGALNGRKITRETQDINHITSEKRNYLYSMNIVNGDGANGNSINRNKTLYYNQYENENDNIVTEENRKKAQAVSRRSGDPDPEVALKDYSYIPINIEVKTSCKIKSFKVTSGSKEIVYNVESGDPDQDEIVAVNYRKNGNAIQRDSVGHIIDNKIVLTRKTDSEGNPIKTLLADYTPYYTYEGTINAVLYDWYKNGRNTKVTVEMIVTLPDDKTDVPIDDEITIVKRDFFMLD